MPGAHAPEIQAVEWPKLIKQIRREWQPGQHMSIIAPTGQGKTTVLVALLQECGRKFELAFDAKGGDSTLASLGWPRISRAPEPKKWYQVWFKDAYQQMADGDPYRRIVGQVVHTTEDLERLQESMRHSLNKVFEHGGWTIAVDEFQLVADRRMMDLGTEVERLLIAARDKGVSVITLFQAPRNVPRAAVDQCEYVWVGLTRDRDVIQRISEILGRSFAEVEGAVEGLGSRDFAWLIARNNPRKPLIVTRPPFVAKKHVRNA